MHVFNCLISIILTISIQITAKIVIFYLICLYSDLFLNDAHKYFTMNPRSYKESIDFILSQILIASSNVRSVSVINPRGILKQFKLREDVNLLLTPTEMGELVKSVNAAVSSFYRFFPKLGFLRHLSLDFENLHALIFPLPDRNTLFVTMEKIEYEIPRMAAYIMRLLQQNEMTYIS